MNTPRADRPAALGRDREMSGGGREEKVSCFGCEAVRADEFFPDEFPDREAGPPARSRGAAIALNVAINWRSS